MKILHKVGSRVRVNSIMYAIYILSVKPARRKAFERRLLRRIGGSC